MEQYCRRTIRCSRRRGHVGFLGFTAHSAPPLLSGVVQGQATFDYLKQLSGFDLLAWLETCKSSEEFFIKKA
jgi:hypothetical protein